MGNDAPIGRGPGADARGTVVVLNRDVMFGMGIRNAVHSLGYDVEFAPNTDRFAAAIRERQQPAVLAVVNMNGPVDWSAIRALTGDPAIATRFLGFGPHVDVEGRRAAKAAGLDRIVSNGEFHRDTAGLLRRYAERPAASTDAAPA